MEWRDVSHNIVIANYGGSKEVDNDDGSLFWRVHHNFMTFGWGQVSGGGRHDEGWDRKSDSD